MERSGNNGTHASGTGSVADILEHELDATIHDWMELVQKQEDLMSIPLSYEERTGHLPALLHEVIARLRLDAGSKAPISVAASQTGLFSGDGGRRVSPLAGLPFHHPPQKHESDRVR